MSDQFPALLMKESELIGVLRTSLYPGAQDDSIKMAIGYCRASNLDPMQKPVHIVPMYDSKAKANRDVIMPGIGLYRTQAVRTGAYAGVSDPEFGADITEVLGGVTITYPSWCKVTVKRLLNNGAIADFSATERWKENYGLKGGADRSIAPNAMWLRRPYAQIAKCAEAQALRKGFPEVGAQPIDDEMQEIEINPKEYATDSKDPIKKIKPIDDLLIDIRSMSIPEFKTVDPSLYSDTDLTVLRKAMEDRKAVIKAEQNSSVVADIMPTNEETTPNWREKIQSCKDNETFQLLLKDMPREVISDFEDLIEKKSFLLGN